MLCREFTPGFEDWERRYQRGLFQASDGAELDLRWRLQEQGGRIDLQTYRPWWPALNLSLGWTEGLTSTESAAT